MSEPRLDVALVITAMGCGGAERVLAAVANHLVEVGHAVTLFVLNEPEVFYPLHTQVVVRPFARECAEAASRLARPWQRVRWLRQALVERRPDVALSFVEVANVLALLATRRSGVPVVVAERTNPRRHPVPFPYGWLRRVLYRGASRLVVQTEETAAWGRHLVAAERVVVIPNPVSCPPTGEPGVELPAGRRLVSMGRLVPLKQFDLLIEVFASLAARHPQWSLVVLGEGPQRRRLERLAAELGVESRVCLPGAVSNPGVLLRDCGVFVLTSRYEGFPNALCEAMACGVPAVAFACPTGPSEIIRDGVDGLLVADGDRGALTAALNRLMHDESERSRLAAKAPEVVERFAASRVLARWEALCHEVRTESRPARRP
jgi:GalNAc-alpha-(1->4)-GalNAc-alpha-(1->3)-diNAcBac-PP-undecaprenol alpha-1,4-N-acetyl-D-galactosaminyltransferase